MDFCFPFFFGFILNGKNKSIGSVQNDIYKKESQANQVGIFNARL